MNVGLFRHISCYNCLRSTVCSDFNEINCHKNPRVHEPLRSKTWPIGSKTRANLKAGCSSSSSVFAVSNAVVVLRRVLDDDDDDLCSFVSRFYPFILKFYQLECSRASLYQVERVELRFIHLHDSQPVWSTTTVGSFFILAASISKGGYTCRIYFQNIL